MGTLARHMYEFVSSFVHMSVCNRLNDEVCKIYLPRTSLAGIISFSNLGGSPCFMKVTYAESYHVMARIK
jgi:hypothetical protein